MNNPQPLLSDEVGNAEAEVRIHQARRHHEETTGLLDTIIHQNSLSEKRENELSDVTDHILIKQNETVKEVKKSGEAIVNAIESMKASAGDTPATLAGIGKTLEILAKKQGGRFIGIFEKEIDLPEDDVEKGDFAIIKENGSIYYV